MRILVTGSSGMLGRTLARRLHQRDHTLILADSSSFDITDSHATHQAIREAKPDLVIHSAAMTAVDKCESEVETAFAVNALGSAHVAAATYRAGAKLIALSTDYVFDGDNPHPYVETDAIGPKTVYGKSKWAGEEAIRAHCPDHLILRVAWLYGAGGPSFVHTMLRLGTKPGDALKVVDDQRGNPTSCDAVAKHIQTLLDVPTAGTFHLTCEGEASWFDFTKAIFDLRSLSREIQPCGTEAFPRPAPRPKNSRLDNRGLRIAGLPPLPHWRDALEEFFAEHSEV